jgi:hypothetical protein
MGRTTTPVDAGFLALLVVALGVVLSGVGVVGLFADLAAAPTAAALVVGTLSVGYGASLIRHDVPSGLLDGSIWHAIAAETEKVAQSAATDVSPHLRGLVVDMARGNAAARYVAAARSLRHQLEAPGASRGPDSAAAEVFASGVRQIVTASVQEARAAVAALEVRASVPEPEGLVVGETRPAIAAADTTDLDPSDLNR